MWYDRLTPIQISLNFSPEDVVREFPEKWQSVRPLIALLDRPIHLVILDMM
jgi:hypothetical protein